MKKLALSFIITLALACSANALSISTTATGNFFNDEYSYLFTISTTSETNIYHATLTNTSPDTDPLALIDALAFNLNADLNTEFSIGDIFNIDTHNNPDWTFDKSGPGVLFDYVGDADTPSDRIEPLDFLEFDFVFDPGFVDTFFTDNPGYTDLFSLWTLSDPTKGKGLGGGDDIGQVAVSFQQLGDLGEDSDLLASNWEVAPVPEPSTMLLLGAGLAGLAGLNRRRKKK